MAQPAPESLLNAESGAAGPADTEMADAGLVITKEMEVEEAKLQKEAASETADLPVAPLPKKVDRLDRLNHLLKQSSAYSDFLQNQMKAQKEAKLADGKKAEAAKKKKATAAEKTAAAKSPAKSARRSARATASAKATPEGEGDGEARKRKAAGPPKQRKQRAKIGEADFKINEELDDAIDEDPDDKEGTRILEDGTEVSARQPKLFTGGSLRDYQLAGMEWMVALYENGLNGILADEMGLGKTVQCIAFLCHMYAMKVRGPFLVVGPLSTLPNWYNEVKRFCPTVPVVLYHGTPEERAEKRTEMRKADPNHNSFPIVITSYEIVIRDRRDLASFPWKYIIVDEGHRLKNMNCRLIKELKMYNSANRLLLTGTPLQNNLAELWSLLNFLLPNIFNDLDQFQRWFDFQAVGGAAGRQEIVAQEQADSIVTKLHGILQPFLLRRLKSDIDLSIPDKKEIILYAPLTTQQKQYYKALLNRTLLDQIRGDKKEAATGPRLNAGNRKNYTEVTDASFFKTIEDGDVPEEMQRDGLADESLAANDDGPLPTSVINIKMTNIVMQLRKCCNHPFLLEWPIDPTSNETVCDKRIIATSGKMLVLDRLCDRLKAGGHKVLIFSQFTTVLNILEDYCALKGYDYCRLDGSVPFAERREDMTRFNEDKDCFAYLLSTRAGGLGINLTGADTVIIYDSDWNPQADLQAQDRCHRIGQTRKVMVYRLITANTIDQQILERAESKRMLEKLVINKNKFKGNKEEANGKLSPKELLDLLQDSSAQEVNVLGNTDEAISDEILDQVLDRDRSPEDTVVEGAFKVKVHTASTGLL